jgi:voltage-gated potassium channel Kch
VLLGGGLFVIGSVVAGILIWRWIQSGYTDLPLVSADIVAFTLIVLGIQTVFGSFFMSILAEKA